MKRIIFSLCIIAFAFSCSTSNDSELQTIQQPEPNFYALTVDNSWVYKHYLYNSTTEVYDDSGVTEEVSIVGTEIIDSETYFKFKIVTSGNDTPISIFNENGEQFRFYREIDGDLVNEDGDVIYTNNNYEERLIKVEGWGNVYDKLTENIEQVEVNAGSFSCLDMERYAKSPDNSVVFPSLDHHYYSDGIGLVSNSLSFVASSNPPVAMRHLESYNIQ